MHPYPHVYHASATGNPAGAVIVSSPSLPDIQTAPPPQFDGPGGVWSPETLLCAAATDCFILTFRGISRAARLEWLGLECRVEGTLERVEGASRFTRLATFVTLRIPKGVDVEKARAMLERTEHSCLVSNSLRAERTLAITVNVTA
jgi:organic hydroperoxide reductase OsmC/OhrA